LLEFNKLIDWIYAPEDEFREKRKGVITAREKLVLETSNPVFLVRSNSNFADNCSIL